MRMLKHFALVMVAAATVLAVAQAHSEPWPQRAVRIILPLPQGTGTDLAARLLAERLSERWGQPVIVENRQGVDGIVGVTAFVNSHDDHTLLFSFAGPISINPLIYEKLPYDPARDLVPIAPAIDNFFAVGVSTSLGADSISSFVDNVRSHPGKYNWAATPGLPQFIFAALQKSAGLQMTQVPYRDFTPAVQDFAEGRIHVIVTSPSLLVPQVQAGKAKILMVTNRERSPLAPDAPTAKEVGYPELLFEGVVGFYGWRDMPVSLKDRIAADVGAVASDPAIRARLLGVGVVMRIGTPAEFAAAIEEQRAKVAAIAAAAKPAH
jgi:tripartite-type tricarboxylate transporter receptor subunit TctC